MTLPTLPGGFLMKAGKLRSTFGKVNSMHNHVLHGAIVRASRRTCLAEMTGFPMPGCRLRAWCRTPGSPRGNRRGLSWRVCGIPGSRPHGSVVCRPRARLSGHHRLGEPGRRHLLYVRAQRCRGIGHDNADWCGRHVPLSAVATRNLPSVAGQNRTGLEPAQRARRARCVWSLRRDRLSVRTPMVCWRTGTTMQGGQQTRPRRTRAGPGCSRTGRASSARSVANTVGPTMPRD